MSKLVRSTPHTPPRLRALRLRRAERSRGQALVEYVLILALVAIALAAVLTITGPAVGNVFSNQVYNLLGGTIQPRDTLAPDDFWTQVAAVASYTPESPSLVTNTPVLPTNTPTVGPTWTPTDITPSPLPTATNTPGPSPTATEQSFDYPFNDNGDNGDQWDPNPNDNIPGPWTVAYWDYDDYGWRSSGVPTDSPYCTATIDELNFRYESGQSPPAPCDWINENFYARYTTTYWFNAGQEYVFRIQKDNAVRIWVGGQLVVDENVPEPNDPRTWSSSGWPIYTTWFDRRFTPPAGGNQEIRVEFADPSSRAILRVFLLQADDPLAGATWNAEYWNYDDYGSQPNMSAMPPGSGIYQETLNSLNFYYSSGQSPNPAVDRDFYARYTTTVTLEDARYLFRIRKNEGVRVFVDGQVAVDKDVPNSGDKRTWGWSPIYSRLFERPYVATAGTHTITVEFYDSSGTAYLNFDLVKDAQLNQGDCNWTLSDEAYYSPLTAWSDSPGTNYTPRTYCILRLRGTIDLSGSMNPKLQFYDRYALRWGTKAIVSVSVAGTNNWIDEVVHPGNATDLTWKRQAYDLTNFGGVDFRGQEIELRFVLDATASSGSRDGWWIDDITVEEDALNRYTVGFVDDMEGMNHWYPEGTWARSNESVRSGSLAWSDSPGGDYIHGTNSTLELDGIVDLSDPLVVDPELVFWHHYNLERYDAIYVEISLDNRQTWTPLTGTYLARRSTYPVWKKEVISLAPYIGQQFYLRFRLDARNNSRVADGWWIDDFELRNKPSAVIYPDWCDNMENGADYWVPEGTWALVSGTDYNPGQNQSISAYDGTTFWSDSPGANYIDDTNLTLELFPNLDLSASTNPEMTFYHKYDLARYDDLYVEVKPEGSDTWQTVWHFDYGHLPPGYGCSGCTVANEGGYNHNLAWTREVVNLRAYVGQKINVRFRLDARSRSDVEDGWWIDSVCFKERNEPIRTVGFSDSFEAGLVNWYSGEWGIATASYAGDPPHQGARVVHDSIDANYTHQSNNILELKGDIDLSGTTLPTLYYWENYALARDDYALLELNVSDDGGLTWQGWREVKRHRRVSMRTWQRVQVDLSPYIPDDTHPNRVIRIRFRLYAMDRSAVADGWWLDDVALIDRADVETPHTLSFYDNAELVNPWWVFEGNWGREKQYRVVGSGTELGPGVWQGVVYDDANDNQEFDASDPQLCTRTDNELDINWGSSTPPCSGGPINLYLVRWTRQIYVWEDNTTIQVETRSDDGIRVYFDKDTASEQLVIDEWYPRGYPYYPDTGAALNLGIGVHTITVEYFEAWGNARIKVDFGLEGYAYHDSPGADYIRPGNSALILESPIDLSGTTNPTLSYWDWRDLGSSSDSVRVEISTDGGFTWTGIRTSWGDDRTWRKRFINLSSYAGQQVNLRFRLDAHYTSGSVSEGWYVDDIYVVE